MAANTCQVLHRQRKGEGKGRRGSGSPSYLAFPISPRDFPLPFPFLLKVSLSLFDFRLPNFFNGSGRMSHFGEEKPSPKEAVPNTRGSPGDLFFPQGHWLRATSSRRNPLFLLGQARKGHGSAPAPAAPMAGEQQSRGQHAGCQSARSRTHASSQKIPPSRLQALQLGGACKRRRASDSAGKEGKKKPREGKKKEKKNRPLNTHHQIGKVFWDSSRETASSVWEEGSTSASPARGGGGSSRQLLTSPSRRVRRKWCSLTY